MGRIRSDVNRGILGNSSLHVLGAIIRHFLDTGHAPTVRELCRYHGDCNYNAVMGHLKKLRREGLVSWEPKKEQSLRVLMSVEVVKEARP